MTGICGVAVLVVLITAAHFPPVSADFSKAGQLLAMQRFYDALGGPSWNPNCAIGWDRRGTEYCGLAGVGCLVNSSNGGFDIITSLYFFGCNLAGTLPVELLDLRGLLFFDIKANLKVTGSIPAGYGTAWPQLTRLAIGSTAMHGSLQTETGYLRQLEILILNDLYLTGTIPSGWGTNLTKLRIVNFCSMEFNSGSKTRDRLSGTLPDTFRNAPSMQSFLFCFQFVNGTVSDEMIASWPNIQEVRLINNSLSGTIPPSLTTRVSLELLELQSNYFTGTIPRFYAPLVNLTLINVEYNKGLSGSFPDSILINPALQMVALNNIGQLQGTIPAGLQNLKALRSLRITDAVLTGTLPEFFVSLPLLQELTLRNCSLSGSLYVSWATMNLTILDLSFNQLVGTIPSEWFPSDPSTTRGWLHLREFSLNSNNFYGSIPEPISKCPMEKFTLDTNAFSGTIHESFARWDLLALNLHINSFSGTLSSLFASWTNIIVFSVWNNSFTGTLPPEYSSMVLIVRFYVAFNQLNGTLPPSYGAWNNVTLTRFESNLFSGTLPAEWSRMSSVTQLSLFSNQLTGVLPIQWTALAETVTSINLDFNLLTGPIPPQWSALTLAFISLTGNRLRGTLPSDFSAPLMAVAVLNNCLTVSSLSSWWNARKSVGLVVPQRDAADCGSSTAAPPLTTAPNGEQSQLSNGSATNAALLRSSAVAMAVAPLLALSGAMPTGGAQRLLLQFSLLACSTDLAGDADVASSPLGIEFGNQKGAVIRGTIVGDFLLLVCLSAFGGVSSVVLSLRRRYVPTASSEGRPPQRASVWTTLLHSLYYLKFPGILSIPFLFLAQPILSSSILLIRYSPGGGGDIALAVFGFIVFMAGTAHIVFGVLRLRTCGQFTRNSHHRESARKKKTTKLRNMMDLLLGLEVGRWSNTTRGSMFVDAWGSLFEGYRGHHACWSWIPDVCVRSFVLVELTATFLYGVLAGLIPAAGIDDNVVAGSSSSGQCTGLSIATLVVTLCHSTATLVLWPFISRWELVMGASPTLLGALWIILALGGVGNGPLNALNEAQVWLFVISIAANLVLLLVYGDLMTVARNLLSGLPRRNADDAEAPGKSTGLPKFTIPSKGAPVVEAPIVVPKAKELPREPQQSVTESTSSLRSLGDVVALICTHRRSQLRFKKSHAK